jgi:hypothetical protein
MGPAPPRRGSSMVRWQCGSSSSTMWQQRGSSSPMVWLIRGMGPTPPQVSGSAGPPPWCSTSTAADSDPGLAGLDLDSSIFLLLKIDFWCRLTSAADTKDTMFGVGRHQPTPKMGHFLCHTKGIEFADQHQRSVTS